MHHPEKVKNRNEIDRFLFKISSLDIEQVYAELKTSRLGLTLEEAETRISQYGKNEVSHEKPPAWYGMLLNNFKNPFILVLLLLGIVSYLTEDITASIIVSIMVIISVLMRFIQEYRSAQSAEALRAMVRTKATVRRQSPTEVEYPPIAVGAKRPKEKQDIPLEELVPGDIIYLSAGDMVPADIRLIRSKDLYISQSTLTGESVPVEKYDVNDEIREVPKASLMQAETKEYNPIELNNICFMGTSVVSGFGKAIVITTGEKTFFGSLAKNILGHRPYTSFDKGINSVTWILIRFMAIVVPIIFFINGFLKQEWKDAFLFAISVAVGLTPEMLPMIVTANLAKGAVAMSKFKVIVKQLNSIQSLGAMDILCTDKTGTLTQDKIILEKYLDTSGEDNLRVLEYGFLNSHFQSGLKNMLDKAILEHAQIEKKLNIDEDYKKIDEIPFDFVRKRLTIVVRKEETENLLICKGSIEQLLEICSKIEKKGQVFPKLEDNTQSIIDLANELSAEGFRVIAVGYKKLPWVDRPYSIKDECDFILLGLMAFLDPPKETASAAIKMLKKHNVKVKILTGDNDIVTKRVCQEVNLPIRNVVLGPEIERLSDAELAKTVEASTVFAKLTPMQKARIIRTLKANGHVVGFLGDGINDAAALRDADVGISVDSATDIARESADIILLEKSLLVLGEGVLTGREVYGNIIKYIKMTTSSNFGNVLSVLIASAFLPFLPMLPLQILLQNLFYDFSQLSIPWDKMDKEFLMKKKPWDAKGIVRFMVFIGPISSIFDMTTFALLWYVYQANSIATQALFQSGWFVEGLISQTLIVHMIRTKKIPFFQSMATLPVLLTTLFIIALGIYLPFSNFGQSIQLIPLPGSYFFFLFLTLFSYCVLTQLVKLWYIQKFKAWL
jgi:Mg2+-importing ATPase